MVPVDWTRKLAEGGYFGWIDGDAVAGDDVAEQQQFGEAEVAFIEAETEVVVVEEADDLFQVRDVVGERVGENKNVVEVDDGERGARFGDGGHGVLKESWKMFEAEGCAVEEVFTLIPGEGGLEAVNGS